MTPLDKEISRETSIKFDEREIQITLTEKQSIFMKLKGMKSGGVEIGIEQLYKQLKGVDDKPEEKSEPKKMMVISNTKKKRDDDDVMMSLYDIRHRFNISALGVDMTVKLDTILSEMIKEKKDAK
jgi:hypothetical protein